jgi:class 3 adenylate cyclase
MSCPVEIECAEKHGGQVVGLMGDAFYAVLPRVDNVFMCCVGIAKDVDRMCEWISQCQTTDPDAFAFSPGGPGLKIGVEYGTLDVDDIHTDFLGNQKLLVGPAVIYASRITAAGKGNRCLIGPKAAKRGLDKYSLRGPLKIKGKKGEPIYTYYELELGDIWRAGDATETYWG